MSKQKHIIEVAPTRWDLPHEQMEFHNYTCPQCNGSGGFRDEQDGYMACSRCDGTGRLMAEVTIRWRPDL